jgi:hypothetical protein
VLEHPLDHRSFDDREHLLGDAECQRPQSGARAPHQDDRFHFVVVVDPVGAVVVVEELGANVVEVGVVVVVVVDVVPLATDPAYSSIWLMSVCGGLFNWVPAETKPTVMSDRAAIL